MVLVVDDEPAIRELLTAFLEDEGYQVLTAANGQEGLSSLAQYRPSLVISDIMMPLMNGYELCRQMHSHPVYREIPLILMSAALKPGTLNDCAVAGFMDKPFNIDYTLALVEDLIGKAS